jgi:anti-sigma factor RsiW
MNDCTAVRPLLPEAVYGDLSPDRADAVRRHLAACAGCRAEFAALQEVRDALGAAPAPPPVRVDVARVYREAAARQMQRLRRWRRAAAALGAAAALLAAALLLRLELRVDGEQLVLRWGAAPEPAPVARQPEPPTQPPPAEAPPRVVAEPPAVSAEDVRLLKQLIHALAASLDARDRQQLQDLLALQQRLDRLQAQADARWETTERYISALQSTQSQLARKE